MQCGGASHASFSKAALGRPMVNGLHRRCMLPRARGQLPRAALSVRQPVQLRTWSTSATVRSTKNSSAVCPLYSTSPVTCRCTSGVRHCERVPSRNTGTCQCRRRLRVWLPVWPFVTYRSYRATQNAPRTVCRAKFTPPAYGSAQAAYENRHPFQSPCPHAP